MTAERWEQIERVYHSALGIEADERASYLDQVCAGDADLRREVESLLSNAARSEGFLEGAALEHVARDYASAFQPDLLGKTLGRYVASAYLGAGGMGKVYRAHDLRLNREIALKVLVPESMGPGERRRRFEREARAASGLNHPNIVTVYDIDTVDGIDFIAMEYVPGKTLSESIAGNGLPLEKALRYALQIAGALAAAHQAGIVHRDLKPANTRVTPSEQVKVLDFGLAKRIGCGGEAQGPTQTGTGTILGTPAYMSPEQAEGKKVDARSDIFSFGVMLYEMLTGRQPFHRDSWASTLAAILTEEPRPASELIRGMPPELDGILARCLHKDPERRFQRMDDVMLALQDLNPDRIGRARAGWRGKRRGMVLAGAFAALVARTGFRSETADDRIARDSITAGLRTVLRRWRRWALVLAMSGFLIAGAVLVALEVGRRQPAPGRPIASIAVLPLENVSHEAGQEYFSDGMTEEIIAALGKIPALRVISWTTAMRYKSTTRALPEIARELGAEAILEGSVRRSGERVRISVQLVRARPEEQVWTGSYECDVRDILKLQADVARDVAEQIRGKRTPEAPMTLAARSVNPQAYEAYLKGEYARKRSAGGMVIGMRHFREAIATDPNYAPAYVGLALLYLQIGFGYGLPPSEALSEAREMAGQALKLDPTRAEAVACQAWVKAFSDWQWDAAGRDFRRAVELSPNSSEVHRLYSWYLSAMSRHKEAIEQSMLARDLEPASLLAGYAVGGALSWSHQWERVAEQAEKLEQMDPTFPGTHRLGGSACLEMGLYGQAIRHLQREVALCSEGTRVWGMAHLGYAYAKAGKRAEALRLLTELESAAKERYVSPHLFSLLHTGLGNKDMAFQWLEKSYATRDPLLAFLRVDPYYDPLRSDQRFQDLVRRMNFPP